jgi:hypothetical protein
MALSKDNVVFRRKGGIVRNDSPFQGCHMFTSQDRNVNTENWEIGREKAALFSATQVEEYSFTRK